MDATKITELVDMWKSDMPIKHIADELQVSPSTVRNELEKQGLQTKQKRRNVDEEQVVEMYLKPDVPIKDVLKLAGITYSILYGILKDHDIPLRKKVEAKGKQAALDAAIAMYKQGDTLWQIKESTGVHQPTLHAELHRQEVPLRRPRRESSNMPKEAQ